MSVNKAILVGRLGQDPELKYTPNGQPVANFTLATNRVWKGQDGQRQEETTWHNIVVWGRQAETAKEYLSKGRQVFIEGRISNRSYEDKEGNRKYWSEVVVDNLQFLGGRGDEAPVGGGQAQPAGRSESPPPSADTSEDDDLPF